MARGPKKSAQVKSNVKPRGNAKPVAKNAGGKGPAKRQQPESDDDASDDESEDENFLSLQGKKRGKADSDDDEKERAVFDLNLDQVTDYKFYMQFFGQARC